MALDCWLIDWCLTPTLGVFQLYRGTGFRNKLQIEINIVYFSRKSSHEICCCSNITMVGLFHDVTELSLQ
jgi:hypothetical protein